MTDSQVQGYHTVKTYFRIMSDDDMDLLGIPRNNLYPFPVNPKSAMGYFISQQSPTKNKLQVIIRPNRNKQTTKKFDTLKATILQLLGNGMIKLE